MRESAWPSLDFPDRPALEQTTPAIVDLEVSDEELIDISETGLLALNLNEMKAIQSHYRKPSVREARERLGLPPNAPTDAELECLHRLGLNTALTKYSLLKFTIKTQRQEKIPQSILYSNTHHEADP